MNRTTRPPTALFVLNYPPGTGYAWGTIELVMLEVIRRLGARGWSAVVCRPPTNGAATDPFRDAGVRIVEFDYQATRKSAAALWSFCRLLRAEGVQVLYLTDQRTRSLRYPCYRASGVRHIIVHDRTSGNRSGRARPVQLVKRLLHRMPGLGADRFIGVSDFVVRRLIEVNGTPPEQTVRVYNGIDLSRFDRLGGDALQRLLDLPAETRIIFASGRAMPYKGIAVLLQAAAALRTSHPAVHFAYAGDGPALDEFRREAAALQLTRFHFLGKRADTPDLVSSATIAVVPSLWAEAFGLTVAEAMAAGVPVVATRVGGIPELITHGETGLLVPPGDPSSLAGAIGILLDDPDLRRRMGARARETASQRFSHLRVADELAGLLRSFEHD
jgi:glycosyltransferase involved in cell wall biosynthesis